MAALQRFILCMRRSGGTAPPSWAIPMNRDWNLASMTPLSIAGCSQLQLGVPCWSATRSDTGEIKIEATEVCGRWMEYFEVLLNEKNESEFDVVEAVEGPLYEITEQGGGKGTEGDEE